MGDTAACTKRCVQAFALALALAAFALVPLAVERGWVIWPAVAILIVDIAIVFATIDYVAGKWLDGEVVRPRYCVRSDRAHGL